jgi:hypothetical protein
VAGGDRDDRHGEPENVGHREHADHMEHPAAARKGDPPPTSSTMTGASWIANLRRRRTTRSRPARRSGHAVADLAAMGVPVMICVAICAWPSSHETDEKPSAGARFIGAVVSGHPERASSLGASRAGTGEPDGT